MNIKHTAPYIKDRISTASIMKHLSLALFAVYLFGIYKAWLLGINYVIHTILLLVVSVAASFICETIYAVLTKQNILDFYRKSFPLVTPLIFVLTVTVNTSLFAAFVATMLGVTFAKLVFGGFGQNIFNPAAVARGIIAATFATSLNAELITSATPATTISTVNWLVSASEINVLFSDFGGFINLMVGTYPGAIGETCTILILLCAGYLIYKRVIDYKIPLFYLLTIFIGSLIYSIFSGNFSLNFALFNLLTGGVLFGAVFMMTDPVTSPVTASGKILFSIIAGFFTLVIRYKANAPEGVLYSILIANMFTPLIERLFDARQLHVLKKNTIILLSSALTVCVVLATMGNFAIKGKEYKTILRPVFDRGATIVLESENFKSYKAKLVNSTQQENNTIYEIKVKGYGLIDPDGLGQDHGYDYNIIEVTINNDTNKVVDVNFKQFGDTKGIGDKATDENFLAQFIDSDLNTELDVVSSATYSSKSVMAAVKLALKGGALYSSKEKITLSQPENFKSYLKNAQIEKLENSLKISVRGYGLIDPDGLGHGGYKENIFLIELDENNKVKSIKLEQFGDTKGIGDAIENQDYLDHFIGKTIGDEVDLISGATYSSKSVVSAIVLVINGGLENE